MNDQDNNQPETPDVSPAAHPRRRASAVYYGPGAAPASGPSYSARYSGGLAYYGTKHVPYAGGGTPYYGGAPYYGQAGGNESDDSIVGAITIGRVIRVCTQRWMTITVVAVLGAVASFAVYRTMPSIYEASSLFEMSVRRQRILTKIDALGEDQGMYGQTDEILNTRLSRLRSWEVAQEVVRRYRADNPSSTVSDEELLTTLAKHTDIALLRRVRVVRIGVRSSNLTLSADLANAYALTIDNVTLEENRTTADNAVAWLKTTVEAQRRQLARADQAILDFRVANQIDVMESERKAADDALLKLNAVVVDLETQIGRAQELVAALDAVQNDPDKFASLPEGAPRAIDLLEAYRRLQSAQTERNVLLARLTTKHPDFVAKEKEVEVLRVQFADMVARTRETAKTGLDLLKRELQRITERLLALGKKSSELELKIVSAKMRLESLIREREVVDLTFRNTMQREQEVRLSADENTTTIKIVQKAQAPKEPVSPNPFVVLPAGPMIGLLLGVLFVLLLDHLEDKITGIPDIEHRIRVKVLAVLPHIRRAKREQVALLAADDRFSHFAEAFAGLRHLMDSPRYASVSRVVLMVSTQPGEGKTVASCNFALSCALSGQRVLLADCDLRRPRLARIFGKQRHDYESLAQVLGANDPALFPKLPVPSGYPGLDIVCTRASSEISPANLLGSGAVANFFEWARQNYDRVIIDSPPFGLVSDSVVLGSLADGIVMLCCPDRTRFRPLKHAVRHLSEAGGHVIGMLVNDVDFGRAGMFSRYDYHYHYSYRYKYGYKYGYATSRTAGATATDVTPAGGEEAATAAKPGEKSVTAAATADSATSRHRAKPISTTPSLDEDE